MRIFRTRRKRKPPSQWVNLTVQYRAHDGWHTLSQDRYKAQPDAFGRTPAHVCDVGEGMRVILTLSDQVQRPEWEGRYLHHG